jgi:hypothetical protein
MAVSLLGFIAILMFVMCGLRWRIFTRKFYVLGKILIYIISRWKPALQTGNGRVLPYSQFEVMKVLRSNQNIDGDIFFNSVVVLLFPELGL